MKTTLHIIFVAILAFSPIVVNAQTAKEVLTSDIQITWFGLDFSHSKGVILGASALEMKDNYIPAINELFLLEPQKFNISNAFNKSKVITDFQDVTHANSTLNTDEFEVSSKDQITPLTKENIIEAIKQYNITDKKGVGLVFIVESLDKPNTQATLHLTFFSMPDGNIILTEKVFGKASGFGIRNYWANTLYSILKGNTIKTITKKYSK